MACPVCTYRAERIADLEGRVEILQRALAPPQSASVFRSEFGLSLKQADILASFVQHKYRHIEQLSDMLYFDRAEEPHRDNIHNFMYHIRKKTAHIGEVFVSDYGNGWHMPDDCRAKLMEVREAHV